MKINGKKLVVLTTVLAVSLPNIQVAEAQSFRQSNSWICDNGPVRATAEGLARAYMMAQGMPSSAAKRSASTVIDGMCSSGVGNFMDTLARYGDTAGLKLANYLISKGYFKR